MPFKVRCKLVAFTGDPDRFPCHFDYKIGDEFTYDIDRDAYFASTGITYEYNKWFSMALFHIYAKSKNHNSHIESDRNTVYLGLNFKLPRPYIIR